MSVAEERAAGREAIHVRRLGLGMAVEAGDPVVEIIYGDEEDVGLGWRRPGTGREAGEEHEAGEHRTAHSPPTAGAAEKDCPKTRAHDATTSGFP